MRTRTKLEQKSYRNYLEKRRSQTTKKIEEFTGQLLKLQTQFNEVDKEKAHTFCMSCGQGYMDVYGAIGCCIY